MLVLKRTQVQFLANATLKKKLSRISVWGLCTGYMKILFFVFPMGAKAPKDSGICRDSRANIPGIPRHIKIFNEKSPETNHKTVIKE